MSRKKIVYPRCPLPQPPRPKATPELIPLSVPAKPTEEPEDDRTVEEQMNEQCLTIDPDTGEAVLPTQEDDRTVDVAIRVLAKLGERAEAAKDKVVQLAVATEVVPLPQDELQAWTTTVNHRCQMLRSLLYQAREQVVQIGRDLIAIREFIQEHKIKGGFSGWIEHSFDESRQQAYRYIGVAEHFGQFNKLLQYDQSALYELSAPSTPQAARDKAAQLAEAGEYVDYTTATALVEQASDELFNEEENGEEDEEEASVPPRVPAQEGAPTATPPIQEAAKPEAKHSGKITTTHGGKPRGSIKPSKTKTLSSSVYYDASTATNEVSAGVPGYVLNWHGVMAPGKHGKEKKKVCFTNLCRQQLETLAAQIARAIEEDDQYQPNTELPNEE